MEWIVLDGWVSVCAQNESRSNREGEEREGGLATGHLHHQAHSSPATPPSSQGLSSWNQSETPFTPLALARSSPRVPIRFSARLRHPSSAWMFKSLRTRWPWPPCRPRNPEPVLAMSGTSDCASPPQERCPATARHSLG